MGYGRFGVDTIGWSFNGQALDPENNPLLAIYEEEIVRDAAVFQQSLLQLCALDSSTAGDYTCTVWSGTAVESVTIPVSVSGPPG